MSRCRIALIAVIAFVVTGCVHAPSVVAPADRKVIDRTLVEYPAGFALLPYVNGLTAPAAIAFDNQDGPHKGTMLVADNGAAGGEASIYAVDAKGALTRIFPPGRPIPVPFLRRGFRLFGPIGGMTVHNGKILVSHRDENDNGVVTAIDYEGGHSTVVADLPAAGDHSVTDIAVNPVNGRLFFGVGSATNSGVVGLDSWDVGWVNDHPMFCDLPNVPLKLLGYRFDTKNPKGGLWGGSDIAVTAPFQPFNTSNQTRIPAASNDKPTAALYSVNVTGGDLRVEAHGIRYPRGLAFNEFGNLFFTNNGMELRGTRPVKDDPDVLARFVPGTWYGWPDFSTDFAPIGDAKFQDRNLLVKYGYPELSFLIDHETSGLANPATFRDTLLRATFQSQSGAAKLDFVPGNGPFKDFRGEAIVTLAGDREPFGTGGAKLAERPGYKVMRIDVDPGKRTVREFIRNTSGLPASLSGQDDALERPCDVKFGPDGAMYLLDYGQVTMRHGKEVVQEGTGRIFKLVPLEWATSRPTTTQANAPERPTRLPEPGVRP